MSSSCILFHEIFFPRTLVCCRWEFGGSALDRSKGNKRNWYVWAKMIILLDILTAWGVYELNWFYNRILVWEDGFCDFHECQRAAGGCITGRFGVDLFFKMSHEVYSYGEG